jgi:hypothetical protein
MQDPKQIKNPAGKSNLQKAGAQALILKILKTYFFSYYLRADCKSEWNSTPDHNAGRYPKAE